MRKHSIKLNRAYEEYKGFKGGQTYRAIQEQVPEELIEQLTAKQLAIVMGAINKAYHKGRASTGAEDIGSNAVWVDSIQKLIEWEEVGAEYEKQTTKEFGHTVTRSVKVKDGKLVARVVYYDNEQGKGEAQ